MYRYPLLRAVLAIGAAPLATACADTATAVRTRVDPCDSVCLVARQLAFDANLGMPFDTLLPIHLDTYDGSGQAIHPDGLVFPSPLNGWRIGLVVTPYPTRDGREHYENPSFYVSNNFRDWTTVTPTTRNPIVHPRTNTHLSDNSILLDGRTGALRVNYRETLPNVEDRIRTTTSRNGGITWESPKTVLTGGDSRLLSPTSANGRMWYVESLDGCNSSTTRLIEREMGDGTNPGPPVVDSLVQPGYIVWHDNIKYLRALHVYAGLIAAYPTNTAFTSGCGSTDLFLVTSEDGTHWTTYQNPVLRNAYESAIVAYDAAEDAVTVIVSLIGISGHYALAVARYRWLGLLSAVGPPNR